MKLRSVLLALAAFFSSAALAMAQETPEKEMEFVRNLRERGFVELAAEYLGELEKRPDAALKSLLPLERARTVVALAKNQDPSKAAVMLSKARADLESYVEKNKDQPTIGQALLELGRVIAANGKDMAAKAMRIEDPAARQDELSKAVPDFVKAVNYFNQAAEKLDENDRPYARLERAIALMDQSELYQKTDEDAINRAKALAIDAARKALAEMIDKEKGVPRVVAAAWLVKVYHDQQDPGNALKMYAIVQSQTSKQAEPAQRLALLLYLKGPISVDPKFQKIKTPEEKERYKQSLVLDWAKNSPQQRNSPEGRALRYQLANSYFQEALIILQKSKEKETAKKPKTAPKEEDPLDIKIPTAAKNLFDKAKKSVEELTKWDDEVAEDSRDLIVRIEGIISIGDSRIAILALPNFEKCYSRGRLEMYKARETARKISKLVPGDPKDDEAKLGLELERKNHNRDVIKAFRRALVLATSKDDPKKVDEIRLLLVWMYLSQGDLHRAAVAGEAASRNQPTSKNAPLVAGYALQAYTALLARDPQEDRQRVKNLARFILVDQAKLWKDQPVTPIARYQLAMTYHKEALTFFSPDKSEEAKIKLEKFKAAIAELEKLPETYSDFTFAQGQLVFVALEARDKAASDDKDKSFFLERARAALKRIPKLPEKPDPFTAAVFFSAKIKEAELMYAEGTQEMNKDKGDLPKAGKIFQGMVAFLDALEVQLDKVDRLKPAAKDEPKKVDTTPKKVEKAVKKDDKTAKKDDKTAKKDDAKKEIVADPDEDGPRLLPKETRKNLDFTLGIVRKYGRMGLADSEYRQGNYDKVLDSSAGVGGLIQEVKKLGAGEKAVQMKDYQVTGEILGLAMRAHVQKGEIGEATELLGLLGRLTGEDRIDPDRGRVLGTLVQDLTVQVRELKKAGDPAKLKKMVANFTVFLDELAKQLDKKGLDARQLNFLATCYGSLDQYDKAVALYGRIPPPACLAKKKLSNDEEKQVQDYWANQLQYAKFLRLAGENKAKTLKNPELAKKDFINCKKVLDGLVTHPNGRFHLVADKEQILWLESQGIWGLAVKKWGGLMQDPRIKDNMATSDLVKAMYFDAYFRYGYCLYQYSQSEKVKNTAKENPYIEMAAKHLYRLETASSSEGWDRVKNDVLEFLKTEKKIRDAYEKLKKAP